MSGGRCLPITTALPVCWENVWFCLPTGLRGGSLGKGPHRLLPLEGPPRQPSSVGGPGPLGSGQLSLRTQDLTDFIDLLLLTRPSLAASLSDEINRHLQAGAPLTDAASSEVRLGAQGRDSGLQSASRELVAPAREP